MWQHPKPDDFSFFNSEDCESKLDWDYKYWKSTSLMYNSYSQSAWNQTLITKINQISAQIHKGSLHNGANNIRLHPSLSYIIKTIKYYRTDEDSDYLSRYKVTYDDTLPEDRIFVYTDLIFNFFVIPNNINEVQPLPYSINELQPLPFELEEIEIKFLNKLSDSEIEEYKNKLWGYIKIENYDSN